MNRTTARIITERAKRKREKPPYTKRELHRFDYLTMLCSSKNQMQRVHGRLETEKFVKAHGEEKCRLMFKELKRCDRAQRKS